VQQEFVRPARYALAWVDELPEWSLLSPAGHVTGYWQWRRGTGVRGQADRRVGGTEPNWVAWASAAS